MKANLELQLTPALSQEAVGKLLALATEKRRPVEALIISAVERYLEQEAPDEMQLVLAGAHPGGGR